MTATTRATGPETPATTPGTQPADDKAAIRAAWALGDYHRFAKATIWERGPELVAACRITAGQRVLDVAAGTGNTAIRAAETGADVVAADLTPENFESGRREAAAHGVRVDWVEADAESMPFAEDSSDAVVSSFGAIFARDQRAVAGEMVRVCRPGGTIGMLNFTPEGLLSDLLETLAPYGPPADAPSPTATSFGSPSEPTGGRPEGRPSTRTSTCG